MKISKPKFNFVNNIFIKYIKRLWSILKEGVLLGYFNRDKFLEATEYYYNNQQEYQDDEYNLSGLHSWEDKVIQKYFLLNSRVIIAGAGGGREALYLSKKGFQVVAFDCNAKLVCSARKLARKENINIHLMYSYPDLIPILKNVSDAAIIGWGAYMHISTANKRINFLKQIHTKLLPGSPILLSFFTRRDSSIAFRIIFYLATLIKFVRQSKQEVELGDTINSGFDHHFTENEVTTELHEAGFSLLFYDEQPYGHAVALAI